MTTDLDDARTRQDVELALHRDGIPGVVALIRQARELGRAAAAADIAAAIEGLSEGSYEPCSDERGALHEAAKVAREHAKS